MKKYTNSQKYLSIFIGLLFLGSVYYFFSNSENAQIQIILKEAEISKNEAGSYGVINSFNDKNYNCFSGNTFIKRNLVMSILESMEVENVSCKFQVNPVTNILEKWSVSVQIREKVFCGDSTGTNIQTPGFTLTTNCKGE